MRHKSAAPLSLIVNHKMKSNKIISSGRKSNPILKGTLIVILVISLYGLIGYHFHKYGIQTLTYAFAALTAILALFKETATSYILRPELCVKLRCAAPDCHKTSFGQFETHYFRLRIENIGTRSAEDVEVSIESVKVRQNDSYSQDDNYVPMHLLWSLWRLKIESMNIPGGAYRFCDLGFVLHPSTPTLQIDTGPVYPNDQDSRLLFWFDSRFRPNAGTTFLSPGQYQLEIAAFSKNITKTSIKLNIDWQGGWETTTDDMMNKEIFFS